MQLQTTLVTPAGAPSDDATLYGSRTGTFSGLASFCQPMAQIDDAQLSSFLVRLIFYKNRTYSGSWFSEVRVDF